VSLTRAQRVSEEQGIKAREMANEFEKSISIQRKLIYAERDHILNMNHTNKLDFDALAREVFRKDFVKKYEVTKATLVDYIYKHISFQFNGDISTLDLKNDEAVIEFLVNQFKQQLSNHQQQIPDPYFYQRFIQKSILKAIDSVMDQSSRLFTTT
jgi:preprotein translocase subunit SecA